MNQISIEKLFIFQRKQSANIDNVNTTDKVTDLVESITKRLIGGEILQILLRRSLMIHKEKYDPQERRILVKLSRSNDDQSRTCDVLFVIVAP